MKRRKNGVAATELGLVVGLIAIVAIVSIQLAGDRVEELFLASGNALNVAISGEAPEQVENPPNWQGDILADPEHDDQIIAVRALQVEDFGSYQRFHYPLVKMSSEVINQSGLPSGPYYGLHSGAGNQNGVNSCQSLCIAIGGALNEATWQAAISSQDGYPEGATALASRCLYKSSYAGTLKSLDNWVNYYDTATCRNAMTVCDCTK